MIRPKNGMQPKFFRAHIALETTSATLKMQSAILLQLRARCDQCVERLLKQRRLIVCVWQRSKTLLPAKTTSQRIFYGTNPRNWVPQKPPPAWLHKGSTFVAKHSGKLQVASGVMSVVGGLFEAHKQWTADELRPDLTQGQRQARAVATGALTATGGWAGVAAGAKIGAIAGAAGGPIGVAIGGIAGGIIGGVGGSWIGGKIADGFKWLVGG